MKLIVGIEGCGLNAKHDVGLRDITVNKPSQDNGGVVQDDFRRTVQGGEVKPTRILNTLPSALLTAIKVLGTRHDLNRNAKFARYLPNLNPIL